MIGYVLDGRCDNAIKLVEQNIRSRQTELKLTVRDGFGRSQLRPDNDLIRETTHQIDNVRTFVLHHLFLAGLVNEGPPTKAAAQHPKTPPGEHCTP